MPSSLTKGVFCLERRVLICFNAALDIHLRIPLTRWDVAEYYSENLDDAKTWQTIVKHQLLSCSRT